MGLHKKRNVIIVAFLLILSCSSCLDDKNQVTTPSSSRIKEIETSQNPPTEGIVTTENLPSGAIVTTENPLPSGGSSAGDDVTFMYRSFRQSNPNIIEYSKFIEGIDEDGVDDILLVFDGNSKKLEDSHVSVLLIMSQRNTIEIRPLDDRPELVLVEGGHATYSSETKTLEMPIFDKNLLTQGTQKIVIKLRDDFAVEIASISENIAPKETTSSSP